MIKRPLLLTACLLLPQFSANADTLWSDFSLTLLKGDNYQVGDNERTVATFEYASGHNWGDSFFFMDRLESDNGDTETYAEWSPRIKLSNTKLGFVENLYFAGTVEIGDGFTNYLYGVGTDFKIPGFDFFKANAYIRNNDGIDNGSQVTLSWGVPVGPLYYDGFIDYASSTDDTETHMNFTSQLKYDLAPTFNLKTKLFVGIEYVYWNNKFGIDGVDERNVNALVKYHF